MALNSRELAILLWSAGFVAWAGAKNPKVWTSILRVLQGLFHRALFGPILFLGLYVFVVVWGLHEVGFWTVALLKGTLIWFLFSGLVMAFSVAQNSGEGRWIRTLFMRSVGALFLVEFVAGTYTFPFFVEFFLVPCLAICGAILGLSSVKPEYGAVARLVETLLGVIGLTIIAFSFWRALQDLQNLASLQTGKELALPVILTALLVPAVVPLAIQSGYEQVFLRLRLRESNWYRFMARIRLLLSVGLRPSRINQFRREKTAEFAILRSKEDFEKFIMDLRQWRPAR